VVGAAGLELGTVAPQASPQRSRLAVADQSADRTKRFERAAIETVEDRREIERDPGREPADELTAIVGRVSITEEQGEAYERRTIEASDQYDGGVRHAIRTGGGAGSQSFGFF
jgi:hypothetical protein